VADHPQRGPRLPPRFIIRLAWSTHRDLPAHRGPPGAVALQAWPLGHAAPDDHGPPHGPAPQRHRRLPPGRPQPGHAGDERLGRPGAGLVAQPAGPARGDRRAGGEARAVRAHAAQGAERSRLWARLVRHRPATGCLCGEAVLTDGGSGPWTATGIALIGRARPWTSRHQATTGTPRWCTRTRSAGMAWTRPPPGRVAPSAACGASMPTNPHPWPPSASPTDEPDITTERRSPEQKGHGPRNSGGLSRLKRTRKDNRINASSRIPTIRSIS
jgi:hypothetical protein